MKLGFIFGTLVGLVLSTLFFFVLSSAFFAAADYIERKFKKTVGSNIGCFVLTTMSVLSIFLAYLVVR